MADKPSMEAKVAAWRVIRQILAEREAAALLKGQQGATSPKDAERDELVLQQDARRATRALGAAQ